MSQWTFETGDREFKETVLERSRTTPVVVDFWAPWCGPCRVLSPLLERLADQHRGEFYLARVNVDENPALANAFRVQSIPFLVGFRGGQVVAEAVGAIPEAEVRAFLQRTLPSEADRQVATAEALLTAGKVDEAEPVARAALAEDPRSDSATLVLAKILAERRRDAEALELLERIVGSPFRQEADRLAAVLRVRGSEGGDEGSLKARVDRNPDDLTARLHLAQSLAAGARYEEALGQYLEIIRREKDFDDGAARKAMLDIFELLGPDSPVADHYRTEMATILFS